MAEIVREQANYDGCKKLELKINDAFQKAVVSQARGIGERCDFFLDRPETVHVQNGMFVVREGGELEFLEGGFSPEFRSRSRCEIVYDPQATCPKTERDLVHFNLSPEDARIYWQYAGLCLLGRNFTRRICIIHGLASGTGKTQLINLVQHLIGLNNAVELRTEMLLQKHETDRFVKKTLLVGPDVDAEFLSVKSAQVLLRLTGGDIITPEGKFQSGRQAKNIFGNFGVMISSNNYLRVKEGVATDPWRNRLLLLEALGNIPRIKIDRFAEKLLQEEGVGILNRAVQGLREILKSAQTGDPFPLQPVQKQRIEALLCSSDSVRLFFEECLEFEKGANSTTEELVGAYFTYCKKQGWPPRPKVDQLIKDGLREVHALNEHNSIRRHDKDRRGFRGIRIKAEYASESGQMGQVFENL